MQAEIGIIGGTGAAPVELLEEKQEVKVHTPYGRPSDLITLGLYKGRKIAILPRHGKNHTIPPHKINFKANIYALKDLGCQRIIATGATGSLKEEYKPGDIVIVDQFIDFGKQTHTFYDEGKYYHVGMAEPFCPELRETIIAASRDLGVAVKEKGTYLRIEGPQLSTKASSVMHKQLADIIGMTVVPEAILSREKEICFSAIATVTDYDSWIGKHTPFDEIKRILGQNSENTKNIIKLVLEKTPQERKCACKSALEGMEA